MMVELCKKVSESKSFTNFILCVIGVAAVVVGMQTTRSLSWNIGRFLTR